MVPMKIGITGGIGSGKSVVCRLLQLMGVPVYSSDDETKRLMVRDEVIRSGLTALLGPEAYQGEALNKPLIASYLFASADHAATINALIHPRVKLDFRRWVEAHHDHRLVAIESAILIEAGFAAEVDQVVVVTSPLETRIRRAMQRDGASRQQIEQRILRQMADEERSSRAHHVIQNDDFMPLIPQVLALIASLLGNND
ncbi:MAG: dephospho-CoA kinase [Bacteroides sp.]